MRTVVAGACHRPSEHFESVSLNHLQAMYRDMEKALDHLHLERQIFIDHLAQERTRADALQDELDRLNAQYARMQITLMRKRTA